MGVASIMMLVLQAALRASGGQGALPLDARQRLDALYPGWRFATVTTALQRNFPAPFSAAWVSGDFDGDGKRDYAVQLVQLSAPADSRQRVVALLRRAPTYDVLIVDAYPLSEGIYLAPEPKGTRAVDLANSGDVDSSSAGDSVVVLPHDGFDILFGEVAGSTCFYAAPKFQYLITGD
jgi:hypothetical protein